MHNIMQCTSTIPFLNGRRENFSLQSSRTFYDHCNKTEFYSLEKKVKIKNKCKPFLFLCY